MERCPICRARLKSDPVCPRCGSDLSQVLSSAAKALALRDQALLLVAQGETASALRLLQHSLLLKRDPMLVALQNFLLDKQLRQAVSAFKQQGYTEALSMTKQVLDIKKLPLALALQEMLFDKLNGAVQELDFSEN
ncbi:hypothetical protein [Candidatus Venteria ishoeyi]|uniref:Tetratricopeptide repeat protein n=1 Tax=Candidatus Venteria ishoeyi TaxID=1899563 RepID=A0A1H6FAW6_9GAMM|nr:hypothetical protein [Candidatus Venteria ishoeyi]SEH06174.1 Uncharacterised protein [Candidatus Venteria ishoeyi]